MNDFRAALRYARTPADVEAAAVALQEATGDVPCAAALNLCLKRLRALALHAPRPQRQPDPLAGPDGRRRETTRPAASVLPVQEVSWGCRPVLLEEGA